MYKHAVRICIALLWRHRIVTALQISNKKQKAIQDETAEPQKPPLVKEQIFQFSDLINDNVTKPLTCHNV